MDIDVYDNRKQEQSFGTEVGKTFALSAVATFGTFAGLIAVGMVSDLITKHRDRKTKKAEQETKSE